MGRLNALLQQPLLHQGQHLATLFQHQGRQLREAGQVVGFQAFAGSQRQAVEHLSDRTHPLLGKALQRVLGRMAIAVEDGRGAAVGI